ncbi:MAG TPA: Rieske 2Fe-2S domain-containing protein [Chloroflexota bacterium]
MALEVAPTLSVRPDEFVHVGPDTLGGRYLRQFWQPVYLAHELPIGRAVPLRILGEDLTLYRGHGGAPHLLAFRCAHRGTQLSTGWVEGDNLRCFYHGWTYAPNGQCVEQPAEPRPFCERIKIKSYPTREYLGLVFAYLGDRAGRPQEATSEHETGDGRRDEPPPFPRYAQLEGEGVLETHSYLRECSYFNSIENNMDEAHIAFVHRSSQFSDAGLTNFLPEISGEETEYGIIRRGTRANGTVRILHLVMPNLLVFKGAPAPESGGKEEPDQFAWRVPVDDLTHRSFNVSFVRLTGQAAERYRERMGTRQGDSANELAWSVLRGELRVGDITGRPDIVNIQDVVAQVGQGQIPDRANERLGQSDVMIVLLRKIWMRELQALFEGLALKQWAMAGRLDSAFGV